MAVGGRNVAAGDRLVDSSIKKPGRPAGGNLREWSFPAQPKPTGGPGIFLHVRLAEGHIADREEFLYRGAQLGQG